MKQENIPIPSPPSSEPEPLAPSSENEENTESPLVIADTQDKAGVLLGFDDDYYESWEAAFPIFETYGARVTFFVQGNAEFCKLALSRGHDIGYHTRTHPDLRRLSPEEWREEALLSAQGLRESGLLLSSFAYPFGFSEDWMDEALRETYPIVRGFGVKDRLYTRSEIQKALVTAKSIDNTVIQSDDEFFSVIDALFEAAAAGCLIAPITTHNIAETALWGIKPSRLVYLLESAKKRGLTFYTYADFAR